MKHWIGIDVGKAGGLCFHNSEESELSLTVMPKIRDEVDYHEIARILKQYTDREHCHVIFERLTPLHLASKGANWSLSNQAGTIRGIIIGLGLPFSEVAGKAWQKIIFEGIPEVKDSAGKRDTKGMALMAARRLYPQESFLMTERSTKPHEGCVDAALMVAYAKRQNL